MKIKSLFLLFLVAAACSPAKSADKRKTEHKSSVASEQSVEDSEEIVNDYQANMVAYVFNLVDLKDIHEKDLAFVPVTDVIQLSDHKDSLLTPALHNSSDYIALTGKLRARFLKRSGYTENDSIFVYNLENDKLVRVAVKDAEVAAVLNAYSRMNDCPCDQYLYMFGFTMPRSLFAEFPDHFRNSFVDLGQQNRFVPGGMKAIHWKKISNDQFPFSKSSRQAEVRVLRPQKAAKKYSAAYEIDGYKIFVQDYIESLDVMHVDFRHVMIVDVKTNTIVKDMLMESSEGVNPAPLNGGLSYDEWTDYGSQFAGQLLTGFSSVIFGFENFSFGGDAFYFMAEDDKFIAFHTDSRH